MVILGVETSCDETAVAVLNGRAVTHLLSSQIDLHKKYGGIVPELACRRHIETIGPLFHELLTRASITPSQFNAIAVTVGPGLIGALLVGVSFAKSLSYALQIPLLAVHHLEGHLAAIFLEYPEVRFPAVALVVSGGHTELYRIPEEGVYQLMGKTRDDAAGEALDKGARMLGYDYPGGPVIDRLAQKGNAERFRFPIPAVEGLDFSFSGLKTALMRTVSGLKDQNDWSSLHPDIAASYQKAIVESLIRKTLSALKQVQAKSMLLVGGVAANSLLRRRMKEEAERVGVAVYIPSPEYCTDNAAMIAMAGRSHFERHDFAPLDISPQPHLELLSAPSERARPVEAT